MAKAAIEIAILNFHGVYNFDLELRCVPVWACLSEGAAPLASAGEPTLHGYELFPQTTQSQCAYHGPITVLDWPPAPHCGPRQGAGATWHPLVCEVPAGWFHAGFAWWAHA